MVASGGFVEIFVVIFNCFVEQAAGFLTRAIRANNLVSARLRLSKLHEQKEQQRPAINHL